MWQQKRWCSPYYWAGFVLQESGTEVVVPVQTHQNIRLGTAVENAGIRRAEIRVLG
jgi:hypothetical protein